NHAGARTTLNASSRNSTTNRVETLNVGLVQGRYGSVKRTRERGAAYDAGKVFKMTPAGELTTLVQFAGDGPTNKGAIPSGGLVQGSDGNFYGTTERGGTSNLGTVFKMTPSGVLTTIFDFANDPVDPQPFGTLYFSDDGNLYGTAIRSVFRLIFPAPPNVIPL